MNDFSLPTDTRVLFLENEHTKRYVSSCKASLIHDSSALDTALASLSRGGVASGSYANPPAFASSVQVGSLSLVDTRLQCLPSGANLGIHLPWEALGGRAARLGPLRFPVHPPRFRQRRNHHRHPHHRRGHRRQQRLLLRRARLRPGRFRRIPTMDRTRSQAGSLRGSFHHHDPPA